MVNCKVRAAFQGAKGAHSEDACFAYFGSDAEAIPYPTFAEVFRAAEADEVTHAVVPVENSIEGSVAQVNDLLLENDLLISGEIILRIRHSLIGNPGATIDDITRVYSHPQALGQCRKFLSQFPDWEVISSYDTAGSVMIIKERNRKNEAAIAGARAAEVYGLEIIKEGIESDHQNFTRFFLLEKHPEAVSDANKTSIAFAAKNTPGALHLCLKEFAERGVNLSKLESRPRRNKPWMYVFFTDIDGSVDDPNTGGAIGGLLKTAAFVKILGTYRRAGDPYDPLLGRSSSEDRTAP